MKVFVVVPAYNEEEYISKVIKNLRAVNPEWSIVVVDDASTDTTYKSVSENIVNLGVNVVLQHIVNRGQGAALRTGTEWSILHGADIIIHFDADGQFEPHELPDFIAPLLKGEIDVVLGSRFLGNIKQQIPWTKRVIVLPIARVINQFVTGIKLSDAHNGLRAFTRHAAMKINITQDRMAHNSNIIAEIKKQHLRFKELPVTVYYHSYGQKPLAGFTILKDLFLELMIK